VLPYYRNVGIETDEKSLAERFGNLDKWAYFFAKSIYPDVPSWKPSIERIHTLLREALRENTVRLPSAGYVDGDPTLRNNFIHCETCYVIAAAAGLIYDADLPGVFKDISSEKHELSANEYKAICGEQLETLYREAGKTRGDATCAEHLRALDNVARSFVGNIIKYPIREI
jgi:hypothetical protein